VLAGKANAFINAFSYYNGLRFMRINKYLALAGVASRRSADELIEQKKVKVNGQIADHGADVDENLDIVTVGNKTVRISFEYKYIMLNKPKGYVTTVSDDKGRKTVMDLVSLENIRLHPVGRLDYDTEGLLILTNDGDLTYSLTHPKNEIGKTYVVKVDGEIADEKINALRRGIDTGENKFGKAYIKVLHKMQNETKLEITIFEGQNRQIRKMLLAVGKEVKFLKRIKIGNLKLTGLNRGEYRHLTGAEISYLKSL